MPFEMFGLVLWIVASPLEFGMLPEVLLGAAR